MGLMCVCVCVYVCVCVCVYHAYGKMFVVVVLCVAAAGSIHVLDEHQMREKGRNRGEVS